LLVDWPRLADSLNISNNSPPPLIVTMMPFG